MSTLGPLSGVKIIELADYETAGGDVLLAEMGADVIKIEDPVRGDTARGLSTMYSSSMDVSPGRNIPFETANRSKRGITLNLADKRGRDIFYRLIDKADIFYTNYRESVLRKLGADYETLSKRNPGLVYGLITCFGARGPLGERRGYDLLAQGRSGLMWAAGERDLNEPVLVYGSVCDRMGGTMLAFGLLAALRAKEKLGIGQKVETSMYASMIHLQTTGIHITSFRKRPWARHSRTRVREPMTNYYKCADGKWIVFCEMRGDEYWPQFARALGRDDLATDPRYATAAGRRENYQQVIQTLDQAFSTKPLGEWLDIFSKEGLDQSGFAYSPVYDYFDVLDDPQAQANENIVAFDHPTAGEVRLVGPPVRFSSTPAAIRYAAPEHGQHTEEVLAEELGYSWEELAALRDERVI